MPLYSTYHDSELVHLFKEDDRDAYTELYNRYERLLFVLVYRRLEDSEEARDIVQDLFINLWERRKEFSLSGSFQSYVFTAVRNKVLNHIARQKNKSVYIESLKRYAENSTDISTDYTIRHKQLLAMIEKEISALPPRMREVFELSRNKHLPHKEIAQKLNITEGTVKNQVKGALKILKAKLGPLFFLFF